MEICQVPADSRVPQDLVVALRSECRRQTLRTRGNHSFFPGTKLCFVDMCATCLDTNEVRYRHLQRVEWISIHCDSKPWTIGQQGAQGTLPNKIQISCHDASRLWAERSRKQASTRTRVVRLVLLELACDFREVQDLATYGLRESPGNNNVVSDAFRT